MHGYASRRVPRSGLVAILLFALLVLAGCSGPPASSFDPTGPCTADGSAPGAYPELEARIPTSFHDAAPETLDSGRNCSAAALGSLAGAGIDELRFAGGTWSFGAERTAGARRVHGAGLDADLVGDFYATSADAAGRTTILSQTSPTIAGRARPAGSTPRPASGSRASSCGRRPIPTSSTS